MNAAILVAPFFVSEARERQFLLHNRTDLTILCGIAL